MTILEQPHPIPVAREVDLCVLGGSCTGVFAAVRAARLGATVALVERQNCFGGTATAGLVNIWHRLTGIDRKEQVIAGLTEEVLHRLSQVGALDTDDREEQNVYRFNSEELKIELDRLVTENKIIPFLHTFYCAPHLVDGVLKAVFVENKSGRQAIAARFFIDATGDGDLAAHLGIGQYTYPTVQPPTPCFKIAGDLEGIPVQALLQEHGAEFGLREDWGWSTYIPGMPGVSFRADTHVFDLDCADGDGLTAAEMEGRRQMLAVMDTLRRHHPKGPALGLAATCSSLGIRETRHFESAFQIKSDDLLYGRAFDDAIAHGTYPVDIHHSDRPGVTLRYLDGRELRHFNRTKPSETGRWRQDNGWAAYYSLPYRALLQPAHGNFLAVGRMVNAELAAYGAVRVMVNLNQLGEAAGVAAWLALHHGTPAAQVDPAELRRVLNEGGSALH